MLTQTELLKKYDLKIRGHLGQHLLMDPNIIRKIVDALTLGPKDLVFEIGPGLGAVTQEVLRRGASLLAVEKDPRFVELLKQELMPEHKERFKLVHADVLRLDLTELIKDWKEKGRAKVKVIGNLPYYISTPILFHLIEHQKVFSQAVLMLQKEVALRLLAKPRSPDYGRLSVTSRLYGETKSLFDVSASCFLPRPQVMSRVISFIFHPFPIKGRVKDEHLFLEIVRIAFSQRRKTLLPLLTQNLKSKIGKEEVQHIFEKLDLPLQIRGEELSLEKFLNLTEALEGLR